MTQTSETNREKENKTYYRGLLMLAYEMKEKSHLSEIEIGMRFLEILNELDPTIDWTKPYDR